VTWRGFLYVVSGADRPGRVALPLGEFLHPAPLAALVALGLNDHVFKGRHILPSTITGKLSDFAGIFFFPLLLTAIADCATWAIARVTGARLDFSLRRWKLALAIAATIAVFAPLKLSAHYAHFYVHTLGRIGLPSQSTRDTTDLVALVMLVPAWLLGVAHIRRVPLGRLEVIERAQPHRVRDRLGDVHKLARDPHAVERLMATLRAWLDDRTDETRGRAEAALIAVRHAP
jgi:hypothetical protein